MLGFVDEAFDEAPLALAAVLLEVLEVALGARGQDAITNGLGATVKLSVGLLLLLLRRRSHQSPGVVVAPRVSSTIWPA